MWERGVGERESHVVGHGGVEAEGFGYYMLVLLAKAWRAEKKMLVYLKITHSFQIIVSRSFFCSKALDNLYPQLLHYLGLSG